MNILISRIASKVGQFFSCGNRKMIWSFWVFVYFHVCMCEISVKASLSCFYISQTKTTQLLHPPHWNKDQVRSMNLNQGMNIGMLHALDTHTTHGQLLEIAYSKYIIDLARIIHVYTYTYSYQIFHVKSYSRLFLTITRLISIIGKDKSGIKDILERLSKFLMFYFALKHCIVDAGLPFCVIVQVYCIA